MKLALPLLAIVLVAPALPTINATATTASAQVAENPRESRMRNSRLDKREKKRKRTTTIDVSGDDIVQPRSLTLTQPSVPAAVTNGGTCTLVFDVTDTGAVENAQIAICADPAFGNAMLAESANWTYSPATQDGTPVRKPRHRQTMMFKAPR